MEEQEREKIKGSFLMKYPKIPERYTLIEVQPGEYRLYSFVESRVLREHTATGLLPRLLPLLDGQHDFEQILEHLPEFDPNVLWEILMQLIDQGLLEDAAAEPSHTLEESEVKRYQDQIKFFSHFSMNWEGGNETGLDFPKNKFEFQEKLKQAKVALFGLGRVGSNLLRMLARAGVGNIIGVDPEKVDHKDLAVDAWFSEDDLNHFRGDVLAGRIQKINPHVKFESVHREFNSTRELTEILKGQDLAVVSMDHFNPAFYEACNKACLKENIAWTSYRSFGFEVEIGPTVIPYETPCYRCFDLRKKGNLSFFEEYAILEQYLKEHRLDSGYLYIIPAIGLAALEVIKILTHFTDPATYGKLLCMNLLTLETRLHNILKLPRCPHCGRGAQGRPTINIWNVEGGKTQDPDDAK